MTATSKRSMVDPLTLRLGTRASKLARWQAQWTADRLGEIGHQVRLVMITTEGDVAQAPLGEIGGQGLFTKRIQQALLDEEIDLAVHSLKDLPTATVEGLRLAAVPQRESTADVLVCRNAGGLDQLAEGALVGTGSIRRQAQLLCVRPDLRVEPIRGNVDTRLQKLDEGQYDAIVLAEAGLRRLQLTERITEVLPFSLMLPAVGQGALGLESRASDEATCEALSALDDPETHAAVVAERTLLAALRAGCLAPVGARGWVQQGQLKLDAVVLSEDGRQRLSAEVEGPVNQPAQLGKQAAQRLIQQGAEKLIGSG